MTLLFSSKIFETFRKESQEFECGNFDDRENDNVSRD